MKNIFTFLREKIYLFRLKNQKMRAAFELKKDIEFLEKFKGDMIKYDESKGRKRMFEINQKGDQKTPIEMQELGHITDVLALSKAVKNEYEKSKAVLEDVHKYINAL